jgi:hypothetical protein
MSLKNSKSNDYDHGVLRKQDGVWLFMISLFTLFASFQFNIFGVAEGEWFRTHQYDSEALIVGRMVRSNESGMFSEGGVLGKYTDMPGDENHNTNALYRGDLEGGTFRRYESQMGMQGMYFSALDRLLDSVGILSIGKRIGFYQSIHSFLLALVLSVLLIYIYIECGVVTTAVVLMTLIYSQWLVVFGDNMYWAMWLMYLPMVVSFALHKNEELTGNFNRLLTFVLITVIFFAKCGAGYEYLSTILISLVTPSVYFALKNDWDFIKLSKRVVLLGLSGMAGFVLALIVHGIQLSFALGGFEKAKNSITTTIAKRTHGNPDVMPEVYRRSLESDFSQVFTMYWSGEAISLANVGLDIKITFGTIVTIFLAVTILAFAISRSLSSLREERRVLLGLSAACWFSILAPLSWFFLAKGHSFIHTHMNHVLWHLPYTIFGFILVGYTFSLLYKKINVVGRENGRFILAIVAVAIVLLFVRNIFVLNSQYEGFIANLKREAVLKQNSSVGFSIFITDDNKLVYFHPDCLSADLEPRFFLRMHPADIEKMTSFAEGFEKLDFYWEDYAIASPNRFSDLHGSCAAVRTLPEFSANRIHTGQYSLEGAKIWEDEIQLSVVKRLGEVSPFSLTDARWHNGISRKTAAFFVENTVSNKVSLSVGDKLIFPFSGERVITKLDYSSKFINVYISGGLLNPVLDGYPNKIRILRANTNTRFG